MDFSSFSIQCLFRFHTFVFQTWYIWSLSFEGMGAGLERRGFILVFLREIRQFCLKKFFWNGNIGLFRDFLSYFDMNEGEKTDKDFFFSPKYRWNGDQSLSLTISSALITSIAVRKACKGAHLKAMCRICWEFSLDWLVQRFTRINRRNHFNGRSKTTFQTAVVACSLIYGVAPFGLHQLEFWVNSLKKTLLPINALSRLKHFVLSRNGHGKAEVVSVPSWPSRSDHYSMLDYWSFNSLHKG